MVMKQFINNGVEYELVDCGVEPGNVEGCTGCAFDSDEDACMNSPYCGGIEGGFFIWKMVNKPAKLETSSGPKTSEVNGGMTAAERVAVVVLGLMFMLAVCFALW